MKRVLSLILAALMCFGVMTISFAAEFNFTDVKTTDWYYNDVKTAVEMGLVNGKSETSYAPDDNLTYAEAIKLAACMNQVYNEGSVKLASGNPWYQPYVDYCVEKGIINTEYNYNDKATRAGYMGIFAKALPDSGLKAINNIPDNSIPDVPSSSSYASGIYKLYRAGILQGVDEAHNCDPLAFIKRSEVAAILTRMMNESARIKFTMGTVSGGGSGSGSGSGGSDGEGTTPPATVPLSIKTQPTDVAVQLGNIAETSVEAIGGKAPYSYQWQIEIAVAGSKGWADITSDHFEGITTATLKAKLTAAGKKNVRCVVTDAKGDSVTSDVAILEFTENEVPLEAKVSSKNITSEAGASVSLNVTAQGGKTPYTYQWQIKNEIGDWSDISDNPFFTGAKNASLDVSLNEKTVEYFRCIVKDANGKTVTSEEITLTIDEVVAGPLTITSQPASINDATLGETVAFKVGVSGGKNPIKYQWQCKLTSAADFKDLTATSTGTMASEGFDTDTVAVKVTNVGSDRYQYRCVITDANGNTVTSDAASYKIAAAVQDKPFAIKTQPADITIETGETGIFSVEVEGGKAPYTYQWQSKLGRNFMGLVNGEAISGANTATLSYTKKVEGTEELRCVIKDSNGEELISNTIKIVVEPATVYLADVKFEVEGIDTASVGVIIWGKLRTGALKEGDVVYLNDASNNYMATINVVKLEKDRNSVTFINAVNAGESTIGILTDLDKTKWKDVNVDNCIISSIKGSVIVITGGTTDGVYSGGTVFESIEIKK